MKEPNKIGGWRLVSRLGTGHFATVYLVESPTMQGALKLCTTSERSTLERFHIEVNSLDKMDHQRIPKVLDRGEYESRPYYVMELAPGRPIKDRIEENHKVGRLYGDIETLRLMRNLLDALAYIHGQGIVHRDIKDANILHDDDPDSLRLIDFGFCKEAGSEKMRSDDSFWRAGAARFSPPSKLDRPARAETTHDVFAVGVMAYRMLTGRFPWFVEKDDAAYELKMEEQNTPLTPITEINSYVLPEISAWASSLLVREDLRRPTAAEAIREIDQILTRRSDGSYGDRAAKRIQYPEVVRDPIHGDIRLTAYECRVLDTPEMQRLRAIKQLGLTDLVYPGATHSRLSHSIGCVARVEQILRTIEDRDGEHIDADQRLAARLYALTHDVLHIAYGHTLEEELGFFDSHDSNTGRAERLLDPHSSELVKTLAEEEVGRFVIPFLTNAAVMGQRFDIFDLVSSVIGADVLDYIDRDAYYCGLDHRIDSAIFRQLRVHSFEVSTGDRRLISIVGGKHGLRIDRQYAVESVLKQRFAMFLKVYTHATKAAASALLGKALQRAISTSSAPAASFFTEAHLEQLGDNSLIDMLLSCDDPDVSWLMNNLVRRRLPQPVYRGVMLDEGMRYDNEYKERMSWMREHNIASPERRAETEVFLANDSRLDPRQVMVYCPRRAPGYRKVEHYVAMSREAAPEARGSRYVNEIAERHLGLWELWVFLLNSGSESHQKALANCAQERFGMPNMLSIPRREGREP